MAKSKKIKVAVGIPHTGIIKSQTVFSLYRILKRLPHEYELILKEGSVLHRNREAIVLKAIEMGCTHLLFVDTDMVFEPDALVTLLKHDKDIIGVNSHLRKLPLTTTVHMDLEKKKNLLKLAPDGVTTCDAVGAGFLLIKLDIFKKLPRPWFFWKTDEKGETTTGEDYWFCELARKYGYEIWVDLVIPIKHIGDYLY